MEHSQASMAADTALLLTHNNAFCRYVWGRGALDVKVTAVAMLEAVTILLQQGCALVACASYSMP